MLVTTKNCGSEPARESGVSVSVDVADLTPSRAGSLPQRNPGRTGLCDSAHKSVAGFPAIAVGPSKKAVDVLTNRWQASSHSDSGWNEHCWSPQKTCGSEPARECGVSVNVEVADLTPSRAGSLPQGNRGLTGLCDSAHRLVGAGLPAIAVGQSKKVVDVPSESLASQLPQGFGVE